jgi:hypothetical protein
MKRTIIRVLLAAGLATAALLSQQPRANCAGKAGNKQDCQDCCVDMKQDCDKGTLPAMMCSSFNFQSCMDACKALPQDTPGGEPGTQPQGHN